MRNSLAWTLLIAFFVGLLPSLACGDELPLPMPDSIGETEAAAIHLPTVPVLVEPDVIDDAPEPPRPQPQGPVTVSSLSEDTWYVIESAVPLLILHSPNGHVSVDIDEGPVRIRGKFADGTGKNEVRTFKSKHVYSLNAVKAGKIELLIVPQGVQAEKDIVRQPLTVMGLAPIPPPGPTPQPIPDVDPVPTPPKGLRVLLLFNEDAGRDQLNTVHSTEIVAWLNANCAKSDDGRAEWRRWDRTSVSKPDMLKKESPIWQKLWADIQPSVTQDNMVIVATDTKVIVEPMKGPTETLSLLNRVREGR